MAGRKRANGEGTIYQRVDGRWEGAGYVLTADGASKRVRVYGATRKEAADKLAEKLADSNHGRPIATDATITLGEYLNRWLTTVMVHRVRPTTYATYDTYVRKFLISGLGHRPLGALSVAEVRAFLDHLHTVCQCCAQGWDAARDSTHRRKDRRPRCCAVDACCRHTIKPATVRYIRAVLSSALAHAVREEVLHRNVASVVRLPTPRRSGYQPFTAGEARKYLYAAAFHRHGPLFELALRTGMRRGELLGLQWGDLDLDTGHLSVRRTLARTKGGMTFQPPKTEASQRKILLPRDCVTALRRYRGRQELDRREAGDVWKDQDLVFASATGGPLDPATVHRQHETICYLAEVRYIRFHDLRHTCATLLLEQGVELVTIKISSAMLNCTSPPTFTPTSDPGCVATPLKPWDAHYNPTTSQTATSPTPTITDHTLDARPPHSRRAGRPTHRRCLTNAARAETARTDHPPSPAACPRRRRRSTPPGTPSTTSARRRTPP